MGKIETENGIFTDNKETNQSAQEVYDEWLSNKNAPSPLTDKERIAEVEKIINVLLLGGL